MRRFESRLGVLYASEYLAILCLFIFTLAAVGLQAYSTQAATPIKLKGFGIVAQEETASCGKKTLVRVKTHSHDEMTEKNIRRFLGAIGGLITKRCEQIETIYFFVNHGGGSLFLPSASYAIQIKEQKVVMYDVGYFASELVQSHIKKNRIVWYDEVFGLTLEKGRFPTINRIGSKYIKNKTEGFKVLTVRPESPADKARFTVGDIVEAEYRKPPLIEYGQTVRLSVYTPQGWTRRKAFVPSHLAPPSLAERRDKIMARINSEATVKSIKTTSFHDTYGLSKIIKNRVVIENNKRLVALGNASGWDAKKCRYSKTDISIGERSNESTAFVRVYYKSFDANDEIDPEKIFRELLPHIREICPEVISINFFVNVFPYVYKGGRVGGRNTGLILDVTDPNFAEKLKLLGAGGLSWNLASFSAYIYDGAHKRFERPSVLGASEFQVSRLDQMKARGVSLAEYVSLENKVHDEWLRSVDEAREREKINRELDRQIYEQLSASSYDYGNPELGIRIRLLLGGQIDALRRFEHNSDFKSFSGSSTRKLIRHFALVMGRDHADCGYPIVEVEEEWTNQTDYYTMYGAIALPSTFEKERYAGRFLKSIYDLLGRDAHVYVGPITNYVTKVIDSIGPCSKSSKILEKNMISYLEVASY